MLANFFCGKLDTGAPWILHMIEVFWCIAFIFSPSLLHMIEYMIIEFSLFILAAGFYICWGCLVWVPSVYTSPGMYLVNHPVNLGTQVIQKSKNVWNGNYTWFSIICLFENCLPTTIWLQKWHFLKLSNTEVLLGRDLLTFNSVGLSWIRWMSPKFLICYEYLIQIPWYPRGSFEASPTIWWIKWVFID